MTLSEALSRQPTGGNFRPPPPPTTAAAPPPVDRPKGPPRLGYALLNLAHAIQDEEVARKDPGLTAAFRASFERHRAAYERLAEGDRWTT